MTSLYGIQAPVACERVTVKSISALPILLLVLVLHTPAHAATPESIAAEVSLAAAADAPAPAPPVQPHSRSAGITALLALAIGMIVVLYFWTRKIRREGIHKTHTSYPGNVPKVDKPREDTGVLKTPVP